MIIYFLPRETLIFLLHNSMITDWVLGSSGANVIRLTFSKLPYISVNDL